MDEMPTAEQFGLQDASDAPDVAPTRDIAGVEGGADDGDGE